MNEIVSVFSSKKKQLQTTRSCILMSLLMSEHHSTFGNDVIIGIINIKIWTDSRNFDGTCLSRPPPKWKDIHYFDRYFSCNNKIIEARYHLFKDADILCYRDINEHRSQATFTTTDKLIANTRLSCLVKGHIQGRVSFLADTIRYAFSTTEKQFLEIVRQIKEVKTSFVTTGSCCLIDLISNGTLYVANLGDSRVVFCFLHTFNDIYSDELTQDHNVNIEFVRNQIMSIHSDDTQIVVLRNVVWRVKDSIQVSRSLGDAYLKSPEFRVDPSLPHFQLPEPLQRPALSAEPDIYKRVLSPKDRFIIFASNGLWEQLTDQEAVEIVYKYPRAGIARRLVRAALEVTAKKQGTRYSDLIKLHKGARHLFHDDITVVVVYIPCVIHVKYINTINFN